MRKIPIFVGFDQREAAVYHTFCQSVIEHSTVPVSFHPLHGPMLNNFDGQRDGTNRFIYSRYLVPYLMGYEGWAIFADGDMVVTEDISKLWELRDWKKAVQVVKHDYKTKAPRKFIGTPIEADNVDYPRKNWSSVILFNCSHPSNRCLNIDMVSNGGPEFLHRFHWLNEDEIGEIPDSWNWLCGEYEPNDEANLYHYTLGAGGFESAADGDHADEWHKYFLDALEMIGEDPVDQVSRSAFRAPIEDLRVMK